MAAVQGSFQIIALMNGSSVNGQLYVDNGPLLQVFSKGTSNFTPNWESLAENKRPAVYPALIDLTNGQALSPNTVNYFYNGVQITFGADNLSNNKGWEGVFKLVVGYAATINGNTVNLTALRIMKNLVPLSGYNNDRISASGTIEKDGQSLAFKELSTPVIIQESTGNKYYLNLTADTTQLAGNAQTITAKAQLFNAGVPVTDDSSLTFPWKKRTAAGDINFKTGSTITITRNDIDGMLTLYCEATQNGTVLASNWIQVFDYTDPLVVSFTSEGGNLPYIQPGQTLKITPHLVTQSTGAEDTTKKPTWSWYPRKNDGTDFIPSGQTKLPFTAAFMNITYDQVTAAKGAINGYVSATY